MECKGNGMTDTQILYYHIMLKNKRLLPITVDGKLRGLITFYIGSVADKYIRDDPWEVVNDEPETGTICFIDQLITDKAKNNSEYSFMVWGILKDYITDNYPHIRFIRWNRYKKGVRYAFYYPITK